MANCLGRFLRHVAPEWPSASGIFVWQLALEWPSVWVDFFGRWAWSGQVCGVIFVAGGAGVAKCMGLVFGSWPWSGQVHGKIFAAGGGVVAKCLNQR